MHTRNMGDSMTGVYFDINQNMTVNFCREMTLIFPWQRGLIRLHMPDVK